MRCVTGSVYLLPNWFYFLSTSPHTANHKLDWRPETPQNNFLFWWLAWYVNFDGTLFQSEGLGIINAAGVSMGLLSNAGPPSWHPAPDNVKKVCSAAGQYCKVRTTPITGRYSLVEWHKLSRMHEQGITRWWHKMILIFQKFLSSTCLLLCKSDHWMVLGQKVMEWGHNNLAFAIPPKSTLTTQRKNLRNWT
jgi:hypothetical protein